MRVSVLKCGIRFIPLAGLWPFPFLLASSEAGAWPSYFVF